MARARPTTASTGGPLATNPPASLARRGHPILAPSPLPVTTEPSSNGKPKRHRGSRGGRGRKRPELPEEEPQTQVEQPAAVAPEAASDAEPRAKRRRGSRGGRRHRRHKPEALTEAPPAPEEVGQPQQAPPARRTRRRGPARPEADAIPQAVVPAETPAAEFVAAPEAAVPAPRRRGARKPVQVAEEPEEQRRTPRATISRQRARIPVTGAPTEQVPAPFAHNAEYEFARILDFYGIEWQYEPRSFPLRWERGHVTEAFTPDFFLPDLNLYVELTTLKSNLTAEKNRKMRLLKELYPGTNIILLKKRDYLRLLAKYGYGPLSPGQVPDIDRVLITASKIQQRVGELGAQISREYTGREPILVGILRGVMPFMADLMRRISVPTAIDLMSISSYEGNGSAAVRILKDLDENIKGRDVILVEDIVDTGMTLHYILGYLSAHGPASLKVCTLLDKRARRLVDVPLDYVGFQVPDEFLVGYGLDFQQRYRNLPFIGVLKRQLLTEAIEDQERRASASESPGEAFAQ